MMYYYHDWLKSKKIIINNIVAWNIIVRVIFINVCMCVCLKQGKWHGVTQL